jgi:O-antigen/teichoic acid export membrane protein
LRAFLAASGTNLVIQGIGFATGILVANKLGASGRGEWAVACLIPMVVASIACWGIDVSTARRIANNVSGAPEAGIIRNGTSAIAWLLLPTLGISAAAAIFFTVYKGADYVLTLVLVACIVPVTYNNFFSTALLAKGYLAKYNWARLAAPTVYLAGLLALLWVKEGAAFSVHEVNSAFAAGCLAGMAAMFFALGIRTGNWMAAPGQSLPLIQASLAPAAATVLAQISNASPAILASIVGTLPEIGQFSVSLAFMSPVLIVGASSAKLAFSRLVSENSKAATQLRAILVQAALTSTAMAIGMAIVAAPLIPLLFGNDFSDSATICMWLVPFTVLAGISATLDEALRAVGRSAASMRTRAMSTIALAIIFLPCTVLVGPMLGVGLALGVIAATQTASFILLCKRARIL